MTHHASEDSPYAPPHPTPPVDSESSEEERNASKGSLLVIFLTVFIDLLGFGIVLPLLPLYADQFGSDPSGFVIGMLMASFSIMQFLFAPVWGSLSDRIGRRPVIMIGLAGSVIFYTAFGFAAMYKSLTGLFLTRIGAGVAAATIPTAQAYIADSTSRQNRTRGMALIGMAFGLGFTLGPMFAYFAVPDVPVAEATAQVAAGAQAEAGVGDPGPSPGFVAAGFSLIALMLAFFLLPESLKPDSQSAARRWWDGDAWKSVFRHQAIRFLLGALFLCIFAFASFETTLSLLVKGSKDFEHAPFDFTFKQVCLTFAAIGLMVAIVQGGIVRRVAKKVSEKWLAITGATIEVIGFVLVAYAVNIASVPALFGALAVVVAGYSCMQPSFHSLLSRWSDPSQQGKVLGIGQSVSALARIFGSALGIPMLKYFLYLPYVVGSALMLLVVLLVTIASQTGQDFAGED